MGGEWRGQYGGREKGYEAVLHDGSYWPCDERLDRLGGPGHHAEATGRPLRFALACQAFRSAAIRPRVLGIYGVLTIIVVMAWIVSVVVYRYKGWTISTSRRGG
jgi:hypothetical protein